MDNESKQSIPDLHGLRILGYALYCFALFLPSIKFDHHVDELGGPLLGFFCVFGWLVRIIATFSHQYNFIAITGLVNPLVLVLLFWGDKNPTSTYRVQTFVSVLTLACLSVSPFALKEARCIPLVGYYAWIVATALIVSPEFIRIVQINLQKRNDE